MVGRGPSRQRYASKSGGRELSCGRSNIVQVREEVGVVIVHCGVSIVSFMSPDFPYQRRRGFERVALSRRGKDLRPRSQQQGDELGGPSFSALVLLSGLFEVRDCCGDRSETCVCIVSWVDGERRWVSLSWIESDFESRCEERMRRLHVGNNRLQLRGSRGRRGCCRRR